MDNSLLFPKTLWSQNPSPTGCDLYLPFYHSSLSSSPFKSVDSCGHESSVVSGGTWGTTGWTLDTTNGQISCGTHAALGASTDTTICLWFNMAAQGAESCLISKNNVNLQDRYRFVVSAGNALSLFKECQNLGAITTGGGTVSAATWYFGVARFGSGGISIILDTTEVDTDVDVTKLTAGTSSSLLLGVDYNAAGAPGVTYGEVWIYDWYLPTTELAYIRAKTVWRYS